MYQCDICGRILDDDINEEGLKDYFEEKMTLCQLHYETIKRVAPDGKYNFIAMLHATLKLNKLRPSLKNEPEKWIDWDPLNKLIEIYNEKIKDPEIIKKWEEYIRRKI